MRFAPLSSFPRDQFSVYLLYVFFSPLLPGADVSLLCSHSSVRPLTEQRYYESVRLSGSAWSHRAEEEEGLQNLPPKKTRTGVYV